MGGGGVADGSFSLANDSLLRRQVDTEKSEDALDILELVRDRMLLANELDDALERRELADEDMLPVSDNRDLCEPTDTRDMGRLC